MAGSRACRRSPCRASSVSTRRFTPGVPGQFTVAPDAPASAAGRLSSQPRSRWLLPNGQSGITTQAHTEVPVVTESVPPSPDEDRLEDLQETRAQIEQAK